MYSYHNHDHILTFTLFQSKVLRTIVDALLYVPNMVIRKDLQTPTDKKSVTTTLSTVRASVYTQTPL
jgi:hypothetical protein